MFLAAIGLDDALNQRVAHDIGFTEAAGDHAIHGLENRERLDQTGGDAGGRSTWVGSPVIIIREFFAQARKKHLHLHCGVVFCASSRMTNAHCASVRPRMNARGAISMTLSAIALITACRQA
jgi:hypothetical protein